MQQITAIYQKKPKQFWLLVTIIAAAILLIVVVIRLFDSKIEDIKHANSKRATISMLINQSSQCYDSS
jgi:hypothetical protein